MPRPRPPMAESDPLMPKLSPCVPLGPPSLHDDAWPQDLFHSPSAVKSLGPRSGCQALAADVEPLQRMTSSACSGFESRSSGFESRSSGFRALAADVKPSQWMSRPCTG